MFDEQYKTMKNETINYPIIGFNPHFCLRLCDHIKETIDWAAYAPGARLQSNSHAAYALSTYVGLLGKQTGFHFEDLSAERLEQLRNYVSGVKEVCQELISE